MNECLLVLIVTPSVEHTLVEWLLERDDVSGFTSMPISGHGTSMHSLSVAEQVAGRRRQVMFSMHVPEAVAHDVIAAARHSFGGSGLHYWVLPVLAAGHIG